MTHDLKGRFDVKKYVDGLRRIENFITGENIVKNESPVRKGLKELEIPEAVNDRQIVAMTIYRDRLFVATQRGLYEKIGEVLCRVKFEDESPKEALPWQGWGGGANPVQIHRHVNIELRGGERLYSQAANECNWEHYDINNDIISYQIVEE